MSLEWVLGKLEKHRFALTLCGTIAHLGSIGWGIYHIGHLQNDPSLKLRNKMMKVESQLKRCGYSSKCTELKNKYKDIKARYKQKSQSSEVAAVVKSNKVNILKFKDKINLAIAFEVPILLGGIGYWLKDANENDE